LAAYGADLGRWPADRAGAARRALLSQPDFRAAWDQERALDSALASARLDYDREIASSAAVERVRRGALSRLSDPLAGLGWRRLAAAVLIAGLLGGATDFLIFDRPAEQSEATMLDPLFGIEGTDLR
jgi:hypothetical protein